MQKIANVITGIHCNLWLKARSLPCTGVLWLGFICRQSWERCATSKYWSSKQKLWCLS